MRKKGFTLAELLIVVAIVAVLVAIAIPVFIGQLEKSRQAADLANIRSAYAKAVEQSIDPDDSVYYYYLENVGTATTGPMQHNGAFTKLDEAMIGEFDLNATGEADKIVKGFPVTVIFYPDRNRLELEFGWDDGSAGNFIKKSDINNIREENKRTGTKTIDGIVEEDYLDGYNVRNLITASSNYRDPRELQLQYVGEDGDNKYETITGKYGVVGDIIEVDSTVKYSYLNENNEPQTRDKVFNNYFKWDGKEWLTAYDHPEDQEAANPNEEVQKKWTWVPN